MKKVLVLAVLFAFAPSVSFSASALETFKALIGAINASTQLRFAAPYYLPDSGVVIVGGGYKSFKDESAPDIAQIKGLSAALATSVRGLDPNVWISFVVRYSADDVDLVLREKYADFGKADKWEMWVNGELQKP